MVPMIQCGENHHSHDFLAPANQHEYRYFHDENQQHEHITFVLYKEFYSPEFEKVDAHEIMNELSQLILQGQ